MRVNDDLGTYKNTTSYKSINNDSAIRTHLIVLILSKIIIYHHPIILIHYYCPFILFLSIYSLVTLNNNPSLINPFASTIMSSQLTSVTSNESIGYRSRHKRIPSFLLPDVEDAGTHSHILKQSMISNYEHSQYSIMCRAPFTQIVAFEALAMFIFLFGLSSIYNTEKYQIHALCAVFLLFAICISGSLTGANINPSVTLSNYLRKQNKYTLKMFPIYFIGQLLGVIIALVIARYVNNLNQEGELAMIRPIIPDSTDWTGILRQIANEMTGTMIMVFFILEITNPNTTFIENQISGFLSIAFFFYLSIVLCPETNSFVINFAITIGINLFCTVYDGNTNGWQWIWIYLLGDVLGVLIATLFYDRIFEPIIKKLRQVRRESLSFSDFTDADED